MRRAWQRRQGGRNRGGVWLLSLFSTRLHTELFLHHSRGVCGASVSSGHAAPQTPRSGHAGINGSSEAGPALVMISWTATSRKKLSFSQPRLSSYVVVVDDDRFYTALFILFSALEQTHRALAACHSSKLCHSNQATEVGEISPLQTA